MSYSGGYGGGKKKLPRNADAEDVSNSKKKKIALKKAGGKRQATSATYWAKQAGIPKNLNPVQFTQLDVQVQGEISRDMPWNATAVGFDKMVSNSANLFIPLNSSWKRNINSFNGVNNNRLFIGWTSIKAVIQPTAIANGFLSNHLYFALLQMKTPGTHQTGTFTDDAGTTRAPIGFRKEEELKDFNILKQEWIQADIGSGANKVVEIWRGGSDLMEVNIGEGDPSLPTSPTKGGLVLYITSNLPANQACRVFGSIWIKYST